MLRNFNDIFTNGRLLLFLTPFSANAAADAVDASSNDDDEKFFAI